MFANILLLLVPLLSLVFASPLAKRDNPTMFGGSATVEWSNNGNHQIRNYHVDAATQQIYESSQSSTYGNIWTTNPMGIYCRPQGGLQALVVKRSAAENDVEIRLFYEDLADTGYPQGNMKSSIYLPHTGWREDTNFHSVSYAGRPASVITWVKNNVRQYRLYFTQTATKQTYDWQKMIADFLRAYYGGDAPEGDQWNDTKWHAIKEAKFSSAANDKWAMSQNEPLAVAASRDPTDQGSVSAVVWKGGDRISLFYFNDRNPYGYFWNSVWPGEIREMRWRPESGWNLQELPNEDFKDFGWGGVVSAITWVDQSGQDQIRLYGLHNKEKKLHLLEFSSGPNGWTRQTKLPDWTVDSVLPQAQGTNNPRFTVPTLSTIVWLYPDASNVHIRQYSARCRPSNIIDPKNDPKYCAGMSIIRETMYDTGAGWLPSVNIHP